MSNDIPPSLQILIILPMVNVLLMQRESLKVHAAADFLSIHLGLSNNSWLDTSLLVVGNYPIRRCIRQKIKQKQIIVFLSCFLGLILKGYLFVLFDGFFGRFHQSGLPYQKGE